ncbi:MAG: metallopeptidase TldD-related protein, partial [Nannocystaceae bacterium]
MVAERSDLDTDGLEHCEARIGLVVAVVARGRARDGLVLPRAGVLHLEGEEWLGEDRWDLIAREGDALVKGTLSALESLADAPRVEDDYDGPMILSPRAAAQLLAVTVLSHASGTPAPLSEYGPMTELQPHWIDSLGDQVMPPWLNVTDDPRLEGGFGSYVEDVQGVLARPVELVRDGELKTLWMSRHPNTSIVESNGRARGTLSLTEGTSPSNLTVQSARAGLSPSAMEADALARAREDGYDHIYVVESLRDESVLGVNEIDEAAGYGTGRRVDLPAPASLVREDDA